MPRDELGLDPYQRGAIAFAKSGLMLCAVSILSGVGLGMYGMQASEVVGGKFLLGGAVAFAFGLLCLALVTKRLKKENISFADVF